MKKIEWKMIKAIKAFKEFKQSNTEVTYEGDYLSVRLCGWEIAKCYPTHVLIKDVAISNEKYCSRTTKSRLNAILSLCETSIIQRNCVWYFSTGGTFGLATFNYSK